MASTRVVKPAGKQGEVLTLEFTVLGTPRLRLNSRPAFQRSRTFSFQVAIDDRAAAYSLWNIIEAARRG